MNRSVTIVLNVLLFVLAATASAEPFAPLAPVNAMGKQAFAAEGKTVEDAAKDVPSKEMVGLPAHPGCYFGGAALANDDLSSVTLLCKDDPGKVVAWYGKNLGSGWGSFPDQVSEQMKEVGVFLETDKTTVGLMDALKLRQVRISKVEKPEDTGFAAMMFDVTGIKSMVAITVTPIM